MKLLELKLLSEGKVPIPAQYIKHINGMKLHKKETREKYLFNLINI